MQDRNYINKFSVAGIDISEYRIVYGSGDEYAASELQAFIEKACGIRLQKLKYRKKSSNEIRIGRVGETEKVTKAVDALGDDGYAIIFDEAALFITGKDHSGVLYGVYTFIEDKL